MIFICKYELKRTTVPNAVTKALVQRGALIKVTDAEGNFGVADLCPWPEFGDLSLDLEILNQGPLFKHSLRLAEEDLQARKNKIKLTTNSPIKNHILITDFKNFNLSEIKTGYVKIKAGKNYPDLATTLNQAVVISPNLKIRLDFNFTLNQSQFEEFLNLLDTNTISKIDMIEDPFIYNESAWQKLSQKVPIALDWGQSNWKTKIGKPARQEINFKFPYLTSVMDHPVGIAHGLAQAQKYPHLHHGFLTLNQYEPTPFHQYFTQTNDELIYQNSGYGIGFDSELKALEWTPLSGWETPIQNILLLNPQLSDEEKNDIQELVKKFNSEGHQDYFLISSSGSSKAKNESIKLIAISRAAVLNSARRINQHFQLTENMNWGCVIPTFHVGGLGILARAYLSGSEVFVSSWKDFSTEWLAQNNIQLLSLVPTQVFDLVHAKVQCPLGLKYVFVGGAALDPEMALQFRNLGWPLIETYGMTETGSMIAIKSDISVDYVPMQEVFISENKGRLDIQCNSLADYSLQKIDGQIVVKKLTNQDGAYESSDQISIKENTFKFLGRSSDYIKILGEGVSLSELRSKLKAILFSLGLSENSMALVCRKDLRAGWQLVLVSEVANAAEIIKQFNSSVRPYEKISVVVRDIPIPISDLGKIKYQELQERLAPTT